MKRSYQFLLLSLTILGLSSEPSMAVEKRDLCICQTGTAPSNEIKFFKLGCKTWNMTQRCDEKITMSLDDSIEDVLAQRPGVKSVKLGYVGHWSSSRESNEFIREKVLPSVKKYKVYFDIHNSACSSMDNPYQVKSFFKKLGPDARYIHMYGYQAISTGGWDPILPGKNNFWSAVNGNSLEVKFPNCKEYEQKQCMGMFQNDEEGVCYNEKDKKFVTLKCLERTRKVTMQNPNGRGVTQLNQTRFEWVKYSPELIYDARPDRLSRVVVFGLNKPDAHSSSVFQLRLELYPNEEIPEEEIINANLIIKKRVLMSRTQDLSDEEFLRLYEELDKLSHDEVLEKGKDIEVVIKQDEIITIPGTKAVYEKNSVSGSRSLELKAVVKDRREGENYIRSLNQDARNKFLGFKD
jgi:hypothetical protein